MARRRDAPDPDFVQMYRWGEERFARLPDREFKLLMHLIFAADYETGLVENTSTRALAAELDWDRRHVGATLRALDDNKGRGELQIDWGKNRNALTTIRVINYRDYVRSGPPPSTGTDSVPVTSTGTATGTESGTSRPGVTSTNAHKTQDVVRSLSSSLATASETSSEASELLKGDPEERRRKSREALNAAIEDGRFSDAS